MSAGKPLGARALFAWAYPRATKLNLKHHVRIHIAAHKLGLRAIRLRDPKTGRYIGSLWHMPKASAAT